MVTIRSVQNTEAGRLRLTFSDGTTGVIDLNPMIKRGGVFATLKDPAEFSRYSVGEHGRTIQWPTGAELCADALWLELKQSSEAAA